MVTTMKFWASFFLLIGSILPHVDSQLAPAPLATSTPPSPPVISSTPCFNSMYNPCGLGSCINVGSSYRCICPKGTSEGKRLSGLQFCKPDVGKGLTYTTVAGDSCYVIAITFRISLSDLETKNPSLDCSSVVGGLVLDVSSSLETNRVTCWIRYTVAPIDTCEAIRTRFGMAPNSLLNINPALDCSNLLAGNEFISVCVREWRERSKFYVCTSYTKPIRSFSKRCKLVANSARRTHLFNPGLYCMRLYRSPSKYCSKAVGLNTFTCANSPYYVGQSDTCSTLYSLFGSETDDLSTKITNFKKYNRNMVCEDRFLFVGQKICLDNSS